MSNDEIRVELQRMNDLQEQTLALATELKGELLGKDGIKERVAMHHGFITARQKIEWAMLIAAIGLFFSGGCTAAVWIIVKMHT